MCSIVSGYTPFTEYCLVEVGSQDARLCHLRQSGTMNRVAGFPPE